MYKKVLFGPPPLFMGIVYVYIIKGVKIAKNKNILVKHF